MNNNNEATVCCGTAMRQTQKVVLYVVSDVPVFIDRKFVCGSCKSVRVIEVNDPETRERIFGHLLDRKALAPLCCLETMQERQPDVFPLSYPVEVNRVFRCQYCKQYQRFAVTDPARRDEVARTLFSWEVLS